MKNIKQIASLLLLTGCLSVTLTSCEKDDNDSPKPQVKVEDVNGTYNGNLKTVQGTKSITTATTFEAKDNVITFSDLRITEIVYSVIKDATKAEAALKTLGKIKYELNYTPALSIDKTSVDLALAPKTLELQVPVNGTNKKTVITFSAKEKGVFTTNKTVKVMTIGLVVDKITVEGTELTPFNVIKYEIPLSKKN
jgi:hypothetical protein